MRYEGWPDLARQCPLCGRPGCAIYRGYYMRFLFCPEMEFIGQPCHPDRLLQAHENSVLPCCPTSVIRYRRISRLSLERFHECYRGAGGRILPAIDAFTEGLGEEFYIALSTAHAYLALKIAMPP